MTVIGKIILATLAVSLISLVGICFIRVKEATLEGFIDYLVSFAVGGLLSGAFLHLFPEALESRNTKLFSKALAGILVFLLMERFLRWRHCHQGRCDAHFFTYINQIGDSVHNRAADRVVSDVYAVS